MRLKPVSSRTSAFFIAAEGSQSLRLRAAAKGARPETPDVSRPFATQQSRVWLASLDLTVVPIIAIPVAQVLHRTQRPPIRRVTHCDSAIHVFQFDARPPARQFAAQIMSHKAVIVHMQPKVVIDAS